jgi:hypothetical protein
LRLIPEAFNMLKESLMFYWNIKNSIYMERK